MIVDNTNKFHLTESLDDERINFLYADFPSDRNLNPKSWESKYLFWLNEIEKSCKFHCNSCVSCKRLQTDYEHPKTKRKPKGLLTVLTRMYETRKVLLKRDVTDLSPDQTWTQWSLSMVYKLSSLAWQKLVTGFTEDTEFVVKNVLEEMAAALLDYHYKNVKYEKTDHIVPWNVLKNVYKVNNKSISEENLICVVGYLKSLGRCRIGLTEENEKVVKFKSQTQNKADAIVQTDFELINLKRTIAKLTLESKTLEKDLLKLKLQAQHCLKNKDRFQAKKILAQRQKLEKKLQLKLDAMFSMQDHLGIVRDSESTKLITDAFNSSASLLNNTFSEQGLTVEAVENAMDKVTEANEMARDVESAVSVGLKQLEDEEFDMDELEKELAELGVHHIEFQRVEGDTFDLPQVPTHSPSKTSTPSAVRQLIPKRRELELGC